MLAILEQITKGEGVKRRTTVEERFRHTRNITFNQKQFGIGPLEPTDITSYDNYVHFLLEILLLELLSLNSI